MIGCTWVCVRLTDCLGECGRIKEREYSLSKLLPATEKRQLGSMTSPPVARLPSSSRRPSGQGRRRRPSARSCPADLGSRPSLMSCSSGGWSLGEPRSVRQHHFPNKHYHIYIIRKLDTFSIKRCLIVVILIKNKNG